MPYASPGPARPLMRVALACLAVFWTLLAQAQQPAVAAAAENNLRISLLTFAPGEVYWQRFGHNALLVEDTATGENAVYNYGMFDFAQKDFFLNFARGFMQYRLVAEPLGRTLAMYAAEGRWVYAQQLNLDPAQRQSLAAFLDWNAQPENADYRYDYFRANCSTRVRDALNRVLAGQLQTALEAQPTNTTYRFEATRLIAPIPWLMAGMDLGMGPAADRPLNRWQQSFVPEVLRDAVRTVHINGEPLVLREGFLLVNDQAPTIPAAPLSLLPGTLIAGLLLGFVLPLLAWQRHHIAARLLYCGLSTSLLLFFTIGGLILLLGWVFTAHWVMWANHNLLLVSPLYALLLPAALTSGRRRWTISDTTERTAWIIVLAATCTILMQWLPRTQPQWPWIALFLPVQFGLAFSLRFRDRF